MTKETKEVPERHYDVRLIERNIKRGTLTRKDLEKHIKSLPDSKEKAAPMDDDDEDDLDTEE